MKKLLLFAALIVFCISSTSLFSAELDSEKAAIAAKGWLKLGQKRLTENISTQIGSVKPYFDDSAKTLFYIVNLEPEGYIVISSDTMIEPVLAFSPTGRYDDNKNNPLKDLLFNDTSARFEILNKSLNKNLSDDLDKTVSKSSAAAEGKWKLLFQSAETGIAFGKEEISTPWVYPLLLTKWSQDTVKGGTKACYNWYTPSNTEGGKIHWIEGKVSNYVCGCVATALAQTMRYFEHPKSKPSGSFTIYVDSLITARSILGGSETSGAYNWNNMIYSPDGGASEAQCKEIGAICFDAGISVNMFYTRRASGSSTYKTAYSLVDTFQYSNAIIGYRNGDELIGNGFNEMCNPNLDARRPCILAIHGGSGGHAVVCDGYGYDLHTLYHHLNMGWAGTDDVWYNLPKVDASINFNIVKTCIYNIYPDGSGEIISGRCSTSAGAGKAGLKITATGGSKTYTTYSGSTGVFFFEKLPSDTQFSIKCDDKNTPDPIVVKTGKSVSWDEKTRKEGTVGNVWGVNFFVGGGPAIALSTTTLNPVCGQGSNAPSETFQVWNSGTDNINFTITDNANWLVCNPTSGSSTSPSDKKTITVTYTTNTLVEGIYTATITIDAPEAVNTPQTINVLLTVKGSSISISPDSLNAVCAQGSSPAPQSFEVWNGGAGTLEFTVEDDATWLSCSPTSGTSTGSTDKKTITVSYSTSSLAKGQYEATITVKDKKGESASKTIAVALIVGPMIDFYPKALNITAAWGTDAPQSYFDVWNGGGGILSFSITDDVGWLSSVPAAGTSNSASDRKRIGVIFSTSGLNPGGYNGTITISDANAVNNPQTIPVILTVVVLPAIVIDPVELKPSCILGENAEIDQFVVSNNNENSILRYAISVNADWLSCSPNKGESTSPEDLRIITVTYRTSTLPIGTYKALITVADPYALNTPQTIEVTLEVGPDENNIPQSDLQISLVSNSGGIKRDQSNRVSYWPDFSDFRNDAKQDKASKQPIIANTIIGKPVVSFTGKDYLEINNSAGITGAGPYSAKTFAVYFRTDNDITTRQIIFQVGDRLRGLNSYLDQGALYINAWNLVDDDGQGPGMPWGPIFVNTAVSPNTPYTLIYSFDQVNGAIEGFLNGSSFGIGKTVGLLYGSNAKASVGGKCGSTCFHNNNSQPKGFIGKIAAFVSYNKVLTALERNALDNYLIKTFGNSFSPINNYALWIEAGAGTERNQQSQVSVWRDKSPNLVVFSQPNTSKQPIYTENVENFQPGLFFDGAGDFMLAKNSPAVNSPLSPFKAKTIFAVFKTDNNITDRQVVWAQGDKKAGINIYIQNGNIYMCAWDLTNKGKTVWGPVSVSGAIAANTIYCAELVFNQANDSFEGILNGTSIGVQNHIGVLSKHTPAVIGAVKGTTVFHDKTIGKSGSFLTAYIFEVLMYNEILNDADTAIIEAYLNNKYGIVFN